MLFFSTNRILTYYIILVGSLNNVDGAVVVSRPDKLSGAEIAAICQEAGMQAVRKNRYVILAKDLEKGYKSNVKKTDTDFEFYK